MKIKLISVDGKLMGVYEINDALKRANILKMDLIKINDRVSPNIYKIGNKKKDDYNKKKINRNRNIRKNKEIRIRLNIHLHDYKTKIRMIILFLNKKYGVRVIVKLSGREMDMKENINKLTTDIINDVSGKVKVNTNTKINNNNIIIYFSHKKCQN